jgi:hypothetical protein
MRLYQCFIAICVCFVCVYVESVCVCVCWVYCVYVLCICVHLVNTTFMQNTVQNQFSQMRILVFVWILSQIDCKVYIYIVTFYSIGWWLVKYFEITPLREIFHHSHCVVADQGAHDEVTGNAINQNRVIFFFNIWLITSPDKIQVCPAGW